MGFGDVTTFQALECILGSGDVIVHPHRTDAAHVTPLPGGQYARGLVFILVYRLAMDARTRKGDGVGG